MGIRKSEYYTYNSGTMAGKHHGTHMRDIILFFKDSRDFIDCFLGNPFGIAIYNIRYSGTADTCHFCNILKPNHKIFLLFFTTSPYDMRIPSFPAFPSPASDS